MPSHLANAFCGDSDRHSPAWHISRYDRIRADSRVSADINLSQDFCSRPNVHVAPDHRDALSLAGSNGDLLKDQAIHSNRRHWMNHNPIRMRQK